VDLALGVPCAIDLLTMEGPRNQLEHKLRDLYRLWNLGFRPAVAASTDFHVDQGRQPIGSVRTYVRSGALEMSAIAEAYRAGRTFATSGPLLDLQVAGAGPGDEVRLANQVERLQVNIEAVSIGKLQRVEIVVNGKVFRTFTADDPHRIAAACDLPAGRSLWVAARAYGPEDRHLASELEGRSLGAGQFAHTSPVYVLVEGQPIRAGKPADADYFVRWCDAVLAGWQRHVAANPEQARHEAIVTERLARVRGVFAKLAAGER
jgi:TolB protein